MPWWSRWQEYDKKHAALDPTVQWNELNPSLHASTVMPYRAGASQCCGLCHEPDHETSVCTLLGLQPSPHSVPPVPAAHVPGTRACNHPQKGGAVRMVS